MMHGQKNIKLFSAELTQATADIRCNSKRFYVREYRNPVAVTTGN